MEVIFSDFGYNDHFICGCTMQAIDHVSTQVPYALTVALCASVGYILSGVTGSGYIGLASALASLAVVMAIIVMTAKRGR